MLRTLPFALPAGDAVRRLSRILRMIFILLLQGNDLTWRAFFRVVQSEIFRDPDVLRTSDGTIITARAWNGDRASDCRDNLPQHRFLVFLQRNKRFHIAHIVAKLLEIAHSAQHRQNAVQAGGKSDRPGGRRALRRIVLQQLFCLLREPGKRPPFTGSMTMISLPCFLAVS